VAHAGPSLTFAAAAALALAVLGLGLPFSINFASEASVEAAPLNPLHDFPASPDQEDGPVTVTIEYAIEGENRQQFRTLMQEVQAAVRRNGAFHCRLDESLEQPGIFRLEYVVSTWAEHLRQNMRMTVDETRILDATWDLHAGESEPIVRHYLATQRCVHLHGYGLCGRTFGPTAHWSKPRLASTTSSPGA
jgi:Transmembrane secretion effector